MYFLNDVVMSYEWYNHFYWVMWSFPTNNVADHVLVGLIQSCLWSDAFRPIPQWCDHVQQMTQSFLSDNVIMDYEGCTHSSRMIWSCPRNDTIMPMEPPKAVATVIPNICPPTTILYSMLPCTPGQLESSFTNADQKVQLNENNGCKMVGDASRQGMRIGSRCHT